MPEIAWVALVATGTALATGLGALPFLGVRTVGPRWLGVASAAAAGVMVGASVGLLIEGVDARVSTAILGALAGVVFVLAVRRWLPDDSSAGPLGVSGEGAQKAALIMLVMTAHSAAEGIGVGVAFGGGERLGTATAIAIAIHNIPEGLAIALVLVPRGVSAMAAAGWAVVSSLPQPLLAVPAFLAVEWFAPLLPIGLGFAAGAMVWMSFGELLPDSLRYLAPIRAAGVLAGSAVAMIAFQSLVIGL